jgi:transcriptional regulator with XRE-family HTH domain
LQLEAKFGIAHGFRCVDLLPYVLDDEGKLQPATSYQSFSKEILRSFNPEQSSLTTWTTTKVKQHPGLNRFLLECGVYLVSDWAILNDTRPKQLERILREFHSLTPREIQQAKRLLESYHTVYRAERLQQRSTGVRGKCTTPTAQQLQQIATLLKGETSQTLKSDTVMIQLQKLASQLRQYRIYIRGGSLPTESLDADTGSKYNLLIKGIPSPSANALENEDEQAEFLQFYREQFLVCLEQALGLVTQSRVKKLQSKNGEKAQNFLTALQLFHCQNLSMAEIAKRLGLRAQDAVTRLLKLKEFRADVRQQLLVMLHERVLDVAKDYSHPERLQTLEHQVTVALDEQISLIIQEAETQSHTANSSLTNNLFAERLCRYLDARNQ